MAQTAVPAAGDAKGEAGFVRLDLAVAREEDTSALSTSLRVVPTDLAQPSGFSQLYRVPGRPDLFMRGHGALYGVFEQSAYARMQGRTVALWPAGTMFFIGVPTPEMLKNFGRAPEVKSPPPADVADGATLVQPERVLAVPATATEGDATARTTTNPGSLHRGPFRASPPPPDTAPLKELDRAEAAVATATIESR